MPIFINNVLANLKLAVALQGKRRTQTAEYQTSFLNNYDLAGITSNRWLSRLSVGGSLLAGPGVHRLPRSAGGSGWHRSRI